MKILILSNKIPFPPKDGGSIATFNLAKGFSDLGNEVTILSLNTSKHFSKIEDIPKEISSKIKFIDSYIDTEIKLTRLLKNLFFAKIPYNAERFISVDFGLQIIKILSDKKFDIIQLEGLYLFPYIQIIRKFSDAKISMRAHNVEHEIWERTLSLEKNIIKKIYLKILTRRIKKFEISMLNNYDLLIPITERDALKLNELGNSKKTFVSPCGFDFENISKPEKIDNNDIEFPSIFHIGALDWTPNQEGILWFIDNCWNDISFKMPNLKFYIAGRNAPKWFIDKINIKNIIFCGEVENSAQFIKSKALMIVPLLSGSGMRVKIIEGMALGKTIISTSIGVEGIDVEDNKNILISDNPEKFINSIFYILNNRQHFFEIGKNANVYIYENFDNFALSKKLIDFYKANI